MTKSALRSATSLVAFAATALAAPAFAQVGGAPPPEVTAEEDAAPRGPEIVVTGSLIRGSSEQAPAPIDVISSDELARQGAPSAVELLKALPTSNGVLGDSNQFDSRSQGAEGIATANLRGLSPQRTLVLLNSKRLVAAGNGIPAIDINMIPQAAIGRIEVLKDGAAATYGSDAIAGVVNFITRTNQNGFVVGGNYKFIKQSKGDYDLSASYGYNGDQLHVLLAAGYQYRGELLARERDFAIRPYTFNPEGGFTGGGNPSEFIPASAAGTATSAQFTVDVSCVPLGGVLTTPAATGPTRCSSNYTQFDALTDTEKRGQAFAEVGVDLTDSLKFEVTALYGRSTVPHYRTSPSYVLTQSPSSAVGFSQTGFFVPNSNPGLIAYRAQNPGGVPAAATGGVIFPTLLFRPFLLGGNPLFPQYQGSSIGYRKSDSARFTADLTGDLTDGITFDVGATLHSYYRYIDGFDSFGDRIQLALRGLGGNNCSPTTGTPGAGNCFYLNPFGNAVAVNPASGATNPNFVPSVANTAELASYFFVKSFSQARTNLFVADASISGRTGLTLPGGDVQFGVGAQYRKEKFSIKYGPNNNLAVNPCRESPVTGTGTPCRPNQGSTTPAAANGALAFLGTNNNARADQDVVAGFAELQVPIFDRLNVQLAARYEDYGGAVGSTFDPQARARLEITDWLALRGGIGTTFRGPRPENLLATSVTSLQLLGTTFKPIDVFGNAGLSPESSTNLSGGILLDYGGFTASVDYFKYKIKDAIVGEPVSGIVGALFAGTNCSNPAYAALRARFQFADGGGVPGAGTCTLANVARLRTQIINGATIKNSGLDFQANYRGSSGDLRYGAGLTATYTIEYVTGDQIVEGIVVQPRFDAAGKLNFQTTAYPVPEWKGQAYIDGGLGPVDARFQVNYIDDYLDQRSLITTSGIFGPNASLGGTIVSNGARIKKFVTADFNIRATLFENYTLTATVNNIFDKAPPFARLDYNYDPFTGNALLRTFKLGFSAKF